MIAAPAMHAIVRISVFFIGIVSPTINENYALSKLEVIIKNYSKLLETANYANYANLCIIVICLIRLIRRSINNFG